MMMGIIRFDLEVAEAMHDAEADPDGAARLLLIAAKYLRRDEPLPTMLRLYLAEAFERSMMKSKPYRNKALLRELRLMTAGRRKVKTPWLDSPGEYFYWLVESGVSQNAAAAQISADYGISESTAVRLWREWRAAKEEHDRLCREYDEENHSDR